MVDAQSIHQKTKDHAMAGQAVRGRGRESTQEDSFSDWLVGSEYEVIKIIG